MPASRAAALLTAWLVLIGPAPERAHAQGTPVAARLQRVLDSLETAGAFLGATAGIMLPDGRVLGLAAGRSDTALDRRMRPDDRMLTGSVGKMFFAAVALRLVQDGRLDLEAPIARWLGGEPWFDSLPNARAITVRQLMTHTSGLVRYEFNPRFVADLLAAPERTFTPLEEVRYLFGAPAPFAAGAGWDYSDTNYIVLGMILERLLGERAYDAIDRTIVRPLALGGTIPSDRPDLPGLSQGYAGPRNPFGGFDAMVADGRLVFNPQFEWAGGGFASTAADLARLAAAWYQGALFDTALVRRAVDGVPAPPLGPGVRYGLGVIVRDTPLGPAWGHSGFFPGYLTEVRYYPAHRVAVAVQLNQSALRRGPGGIVQHLAETLLGDPVGIPTLDLAADTGRQTVVDREPGQYLGHPTTVLLDDGRSILTVYPKGHGRGPIVMKRSPDGGRTWSQRLPVPENWATSQEVPTLFRVQDRAGVRRLLLFSGLYPIRMAVSEDDGATWSPLRPIGNFGGIVAMASVVRLANGDHLAFFHDDGRFLRNAGERSIFRVYATRSADGGLTWGAPAIVAERADVDLCEPGAVRSPDGTTIALLLRENRRVRNSFVVVSTDEGATWSEPRELPAALTGDRHTARYAPDGRLFVSFRDMADGSPTRGDWVGWVGTFEDILEGRAGQYRVRLMDNTDAWDAAYPGVEVLADGTFVVTSYGHWIAGEAPYVVTVRFTLPELDRLAAAR